MSTVYQVAAEAAGTAAQHVRFANPPNAVRSLIRDLFEQRRADPNLLVESIRADQVPTHVWKPLDEFAASVANTDDCRVIELRKCSSCFVGDAPGNLILTTSGTQCWQCES